LTDFENHARVQAVIITDFRLVPWRAGAKWCMVEIMWHRWATG